MDKLQEVLTYYQLGNKIEGNILIHNFYIDKDKDINDISKLYFKKGLKIPNNASILGTLALLPKKDIVREIHNYCIKGNYKLIVHIPYQIENIFLGDIEKRYGSSGNQYFKNSLLDLLYLKYLPREFIVGILYNDEPNDFMEFNNSKFIHNPFYFNSELNKASNTNNLITNLYELIENKHDIIKMCMNYIPYDEERFEKNIKIAEHYFDDDRILFFKKYMNENLVYKALKTLQMDASSIDKIDMNDIVDELFFE